ncbi:MAG: fumarate hydratase [Clostridia bacterium]|nr:fumarate hydratase [Clostridia bacterium]MBQ2349115.1 fumarate hydratase [Clostridia bacterium]
MDTRQIEASEITLAVKKMFMDCNYFIGDDILSAIKSSYEEESLPVAKDVLKQLIDNHEIASSEEIPICQDTGMAVLFVEYGDKVTVANGSFTDAVNEGVRRAYIDGYLRKSVVSDPVFDRINTKDNTPAVIHTQIVPGDKIKITAGGKGFGSENMSAVKMLTPSAGVEGVKKFILDTVAHAGPNPCPPMVIGVGIGGTFEKAAELAKRATMRRIDTSNPDKRYAELEKELLEEVNKMNIGPAGLGGKTTALGLNIETYPTHIAGMPVAVNICCHASRHKECVI